jgi:predicted GIY-YIG superfamily endonuclease
VENVFVWATLPRVSEKQLLLFSTSKPLKERFGNAFFKSAPQAPGVYLMAAADERVLYVGQSGNLRKRLAFYKNADLAKAAGKLRRLIASVHTITWQVCASTQQAKLRENEMLRLHQPRHNVMNARPKSYAFIGVTYFDQTVRLRLSLAHDPQDGETLYGVFKNRGGAIRAFGALCRLLWAIEVEPMNIHGFPSHILRNKATRAERFKFSPGCVPAATLGAALLRGFFLGESDALIGMLSAELKLWHERLDPFAKALLGEDMRALQDFYQSGPVRNASLRARHGISDPLIGQDEIDDLIILAAHK